MLKRRFLVGEIFSFLLQFCCICYRIVAKDLFIMRIISGVCRGRKLNTLEGDNTRPTLDRVKESVFNILQNFFADKNVLDLFAGSGALGLEALSRGAEFCVFVDSSKSAVRVIESNIKACRFEDKSEVYLGDFQGAISKFRNKRFDIVFLDPPYHKGLGVEALKLLYDATSDDAIVILEIDGDEEVFECVGGFAKYDLRSYGRVKVVFYRKCE